jgi:hypothetical protein
MTSSRAVKNLFTAEGGQRRRSSREESVSPTGFRVSKGVPGNLEDRRHCVSGGRSNSFVHEAFVNSASEIEHKLGRGVTDTATDPRIDRCVRRNRWTFAGDGRHTEDIGEIRHGSLCSVSLPSGLRVRRDLVIIDTRGWWVAYAMWANPHVHQPEAGSIQKAPRSDIQTASEQGHGSE